MTEEDQIARPDSTAVRVALWRALHIEVDPQPHVLEDYKNSGDRIGTGVLLQP
jgi:hypothetical protein